MDSRDDDAEDANTDTSSLRVEAVDDMDRTETRVTVDLNAIVLPESFVRLLVGGESVC